MPTENEEVDIKKDEEPINWEVFLNDGEVKDISEVYK